MLTLAIDTATKVCSVALCDNEKIIGEYSIDAGMTHSDGLLPQIMQMLERSKVNKDELELLAVSTGPGSFTGLRIGVATMEALAYSLEIPLIGVSTLQALAYNLSLTGFRLIPLLDAQKGNFYAAAYEWEDNILNKKANVAVWSADEVINYAKSSASKVLLLGECLKLSEKIAVNNIGIVPENLRLPKASSVALLGVHNFLKGDRETAFLTNLEYIRRSEAEELWEKRCQKS
ncbi:MAG TPA: tRNA (adenosine(37)-N6)-threonylcarbamoyltransferase complex dimerization subunit type 1 TsaB [Candidatus Avacidaminococcus intestinavium]|uniref:tRNA (Adenosine(37)-N6)-threonylcarbamoyltransferase complex dimerization subunit type 1 TsaB n=1 Tax=Candidatus Avacidaminococcus intestinavium TaxID=2840684 RepID=A0A9D1MQG3_9FIRM|nr:tRNA (adenosine(37)-N6)-threonylcarbamoyltransferase complex dimerization subunit type 1 TsaB [Candidatus Avacidaminococcus intestinavium]